MNVGRTVSARVPHTVERDAEPRDAQPALAWAGITGPVLFTAAFLAQEVHQGDAYDRVSDPVSALAAGPDGWVQNVNFAVFGVLTLLFALGLHRAVRPSGRGYLGPLLFALSGVGLLLASVFPLARDADGTIYDPGGHAVAGFLFFGSTALAFLVLSRRLARDPRWRGLARHTLSAGAVAAVGFVVTGTLVIPEGAPLHDWGGLVQRGLVLLVIFPVRIALSVRMLRSTG